MPQIAYSVYYKQTKKKGFMNGNLQDCKSRVEYSCKYFFYCKKKHPFNTIFDIKKKTWKRRYNFLQISK